MEFLIQIGFVAFLLIVGLIFGSMNERRHLRKLAEREAALRHVLIFNEKRPAAICAGRPFHFAQGSVVISSDYFKTTAASIKSLFGGRLTTYETLLDRGRREAIVRMKEDAQRHGASMVFGVRFETSNLAGNGAGSGLACAEFLAYGTAWKV